MKFLNNLALGFEKIDFLENDSVKLINSFEIIRKALLQVAEIFCLQHDLERYANVF